MRIALITPGFSAHGADWCIPVLLNHVKLLAQSHDVHVFPLRYPYDRTGYEVVGAKVHPLGGATARGLARGTLLKQALRRIQQEARTNPFDVYHACWADEPGFLAALLATLTKKPAVVSLMGGELAHFPEIGYGGRQSKANRIMLRMALRFANRVTAGSAYLRNVALPYVKAERIQVHPWGVDTTRFMPNSEAEPLIPHDGFHLLHVASLIGIKDHQTSLQAVQIVARSIPDVYLHLVGTGPLHRELEQDCGRLGIDRNVLFHQSIPHDELPRYYQAADLCLLTSRHEAQAMVVLEAAACARTTVGTAVGLVPELVPMKMSVPPKDAEGLARVIMELHTHREHLMALNRHVLNLIQTRYSLTQSTENLVRLYHSLV